MTRFDDDILESSRQIVRYERDGKWFVAALSRINRWLLCKRRQIELKRIELKQKREQGQ